MEKLRSPALPIAAKILALSESGYKALHKLEKGCAYRMNGAWRFRGSHSPAHNATLVVLLAKGLAELVDIGGLAQVRITQAGRAARREGTLEGRPPPTDATRYSRARTSLATVSNSEASSKAGSRSFSRDIR